MAEVTVAKLAEIVGAPVDRLLTQMKEAGLEHMAAKDKVSDEEKQTLLAYLKRCHGDTDATPKKITLKRKVTTQLKTSSSQGRSAKTVNVEVRKKRTYVKRSAIEAEQSAEKLEAEVLRREEEKRLEDEKAAKLAAEQAQRDELEAAVEGESKTETIASQDEQVEDGSAALEVAPEVDETEESAEDDEPTVKELSEAERLKLEKEEREALKTPDKKAKKVEKSKTSKKKWIEEAD